MFEKRERPLGECVVCHKEKPVYNHVHGDPDAPLCGACNMRERREAASNIQAKILKLSATVIGSLEVIGGLPLEEHHKKELQQMQDRFKVLVRVWLGDESAEEEDTALSDRKAAVTPKSGAQASKRGPMSPEHRQKISAAHKAKAAAKQPKLLPAPAELVEAVVQ